MRRNRNMGRGGGGGNLNMSGGPLLTEHLKDIDLELELLKRKREMLEQQQFLQPFNQQLQRSYSQQQYSYNQNEPKQGGSNCDFSHLYNDGPQQYRKPFGKKRQSDNDWHHDSFPKRSAGQGQRGPSNSGPSPIRNPRPYSGPSQSKAVPFKYGQGKQSIGQKISNQKNQRPEKRFVPSNKITKPSKAFAPPNKIASQPVAARKDLVAAAIKSVADAEHRDREALRLLPDKVPTKQMTGRMELALGAILRDIREMCADSPHEDALRPANVQRVIKQAIRERIRSAMLGKIIGATQEIIKEYRDKYPKETDNEILNKALEEAGIDHASEIKLDKTTTPNDFYKQNLSKLIDSHLQEMFDKIDEIYNPPPPKVEVDFTEDNVEPEVQPKAPEETVKPEENEASPNEEALVNVNPNEYKRMLPRLLKRHIPTIIKLLNINKMYRSAVADLTTATRTMYMEYDKTSDGAASTTAQTTDRAARLLPNVLPYYVKVMGKPQLPKKKVMHTFLEVFNPKSIKKHRNIHNLLFIGFANKEDFDGIVKADGTIIGRSTLSIRVCDRAAGKSDDRSAIDLTGDEDLSFKSIIYTYNKDDSHNNSDILGTDLDGQINELLTSIRKSEESEGKDGDSEKKEDSDKAQEDADENILVKEESKENIGTEEVLAENKHAEENTAINTVADETAPVEKVSNGDANNDTNTQAETNSQPENNEESQSQQENNEESKSQQENNEETKLQPENNEETNIDFEQVTNGEKNDQVSDLKNATGRSTPTRASARLSNAPATPGSIRTRRASRLLQN